jgi:hypothetical protein
MKIFGILSSSGLPTVITGAIIETADLDTKGDVKELTGNPPTDVVDVRMGKITQTMKVTCEFESYVTPENQRAMLASTDTYTVVITSLDTETVTLEGKIIDISCGAKKEDWWSGSFTIQYVVPIA